MRVRTRSQPRSVTGEILREIYDGYYGGVHHYHDEISTKTWSVASSQETVDGIHDWPSAANEGRDIGGPFVSKKSEGTINAPIIRSDWRAGPDYMYTGPLVAEAGSIPVSSLGSRSTESSLNAVGTTAIARSIPTNPPANVSVMLGELFREGVPKAVGASLLKNRFRDYRDIGSEYLNFEFGWKPIVADLKSVAKAVRESERILNQLERDSGRNVRRKFVFPTVNKSSNRVLTNFSTATERALLSGMVWPAQTTVISEHFSQRRWFSGCFTYHFERPSGQRAAMADAAQKARLLYGVDLTPEVVWNLAPWTWLADWVSNAGDIMTNVSRFSRDGLVMRYGYIMENTFRSYSIDCQNVSVSRSWGGPRDLFSCSTSWTEEFKVRQTATPFGFGLTAESFDPRQWAILGALGISRGPNVL